MNGRKSHWDILISHLMMIFLMVIFAVWLKNIRIESDWQQAGIITFSLGFVLLMAFVCAKMLLTFKLPMISGYIFAGIIAGPYITGFLTETMVQRLRLVDDLALSFIALTAGGSLSLGFFQQRGKAIALNIILLIPLVFGLVFLFIIFTGNYFDFTRNLGSKQTIVLACLLGVIAVARSPSSAIAIISECRASGIFTSTVLGVTVATDVLIIVFFTVAISVMKILLTTSGVLDLQVFIALFLELLGSLIIGVLLGKGVSLYIKKVGHDLPLFLLFFAFGVFKISLWLNYFMEDHFFVSLHLEPLLICMSAGFTVSNFSKTGSAFIESLERISLPIYVLFFSLAGASLNLGALRIAWFPAVCIAFVRVMGIFGATWLAGTIIRDPANHNRIAWMAYLAQAGVAIGLAQIAQRRFPETGIYLTTIVLAVISINQVVGPITFKMALNMAGETGKD